MIPASAGAGAGADAGAMAEAAGPLCQQLYSLQYSLKFMQGVHHDISVIRACDSASVVGTISSHNGVLRSGYLEMCHPGHKNHSCLNGSGDLF